jgi:hypothetical protein
LSGLKVGDCRACYVAVPARIVGMRTAKPATTAQSGPAKLAAAGVTGLFGAIVRKPPYVIARGGIALLGSSALFLLGVALLSCPRRAADSCPPRSQARMKCSSYSLICPFMPRISLSLESRGP